MAQINVADFSGTSTAIEKPNANGQAANAGSRPVTLSTENMTVIGNLLTAMQAATPAGSNVIGGVTGSGNFAITAAALPLPSGAATAAKQPALGTAGSASTDVLSIQGIANGVAQDTVVKAAATNRGMIVGFSGAQISTTSASPTITLTTAPTSGAIVLGQQLIAAGVPAGTTINALASGTLNAVSSTYTLSANATATATGVASTSVGPQALMASNTSRRGYSIQNQGSGNLYVNNITTATADYNSLLLIAGSYYEAQSSHTVTAAISVMAATAATAVYAREW